MSITPPPPPSRPTAQSKTVSRRAALGEDLATSESRVQTLVSEKSELQRDRPQREEAATRKEKQLDHRDRKLRGRAQDVKRREKVISKVENRIAANTFGDGVYEVGVDIAPGAHRKAGGTTGCYYAILASSNSHDIVANTLIGGTPVMSVANGQHFETTRGGEWVLQR